jgi:hypothetical protein
MAKAKHEYLIREGMEFIRQYYGKNYRLLVVKHHGILQFKVEDMIFATLTAAARYVCRDDTRSISGPVFWGIKRT